MDEEMGVQVESIETLSYLVAGLVAESAARHVMQSSPAFREPSKVIKRETQERLKSARGKSAALSPSDQINYKHLLQKYMNHIVCSTGTYYLTHASPGATGAHSEGDFEWTENDISALCDLAGKKELKD